ncbi:MAG: hypothetical protein B5M46_03265 [Epsilonproteobacteria bacterium 4484_20]|nr:MAG: hypothetical protein B5M46_03265 [Epsilonproteobacteria bacterium 4484_20]
MFKNKICILVCLGILLPVFSLAAPLDKYYIPQQASGYTTQKTGPDIDTEFRNTISSLSPEEREKLKGSFREKMDNAAKNKNFDAAAYYQHLLDILNTF